MSTDSFNLAPAEAGATLTAPQPTTTQAAADTTTPKKTKKKNEAAPETPTDGTVAGAVIPGAALTGLISLCWMIHQFGLPAVLAGVIACALAASAALVAKARRGTRSVRNARKNALGAVGGGGGAGPGRSKGGSGQSLRSSAGGGSFGGSGRGGNRKPGSGSLGGFGGGGKAGSTGPGRSGGPASLKPAGLNTAKNGTGKSGATFSPAPGRTGAGGAGGGGKNRIPNQPKHRGGTTSTGLGSVGTSTGPGNRGGRGGPNRKSPAADRLGRIHDRKNTSGTQNTPNMKPFKDAPKTSTPTRPLSKNETKKNRALKEAARKNGAAAVELTKDILKNAKKQKETEGSRRQRRVSDRLDKTRGKVKRIKQFQKDKAELKEARSDLWRLRKLRIKTATARVRTAVRPVTRRFSRAAAHVWRFGTHAFNRAHMMLGTIRYADLGPNWVRPLAKLLHAVTSPVARLIHATGSWNWLNKWMYRNTTTQPDPNGPKLKPVSPAAVAAAVIRDHAAHQAVNSPWDAPSPKGTPAMSSSLSGAMPLAYAAEAVRNAGIMLLINPAENMTGYEATIRQLSDVQAAISQVVQAAAASTRENFAVNPVISDAYDDTAQYGYSLAERLDAIPVLFRMVHAEQLKNLENPTPQAAKWDIGANLND
ncbi:hypothetical protein ABZ826_23925 [Streptomyces sp. NPDC047515]|uniref:hypothetical protein n=1 Tax=Streptomyces sp. NPDC047515 TaxID=3155380 RepID=UPI0033E4EB8B